MAVKIKLARLGKIREPFYRVVVADARTRRGGRAIELIGRYQPKLEPSLIEIDSDRAQYWLGVGAQPTASVLALLKVTGDWQKFRGLPGAEGTVRPQPEKVAKRTRYEAALAAIGGDDASVAPTPRKRPARKDAATAPTDEPGAVEEAAETAAAEAPAAAEVPASAGDAAASETG